MDTKLKINIRGTKGIVASYDVAEGQHAAQVIKVPPDGKFTIELQDSVTGRAPQMVKTKRVGNNLHLIFAGDDENNTDVILEDYYRNEDLRLIGQSEDGQYYEYVPTTGEMSDYTLLLKDGSSSTIALGGEGSALATPSDEGNTFAWLPLLLLGGGAALAGGAAYAQSQRENNESGSDSHNVAISMNPTTDNDQDGRPEFSGTSTPDAVVVIKLPDGAEITTTTDKNGNWAIEAPQSQPNGTVTVTVTDKDGNTGTISERFEDDTAPEKPTLTANDDQQLAGKGEPGSTITITDPATGESSTVVADDEGNWSISPNPVGEGAENVTVVAEDPAGNASPPLIIGRPDLTAPDNVTSGLKMDSITLVDDVAPVKGIIADGGTTNDTRPTYSGKATADIVSVNIYDNGALVGSAKVGKDGSWSFTSPTSLAEGSSHNYTAAAVDKGGNEGPRVSGTTDDGWTFTIDSLPPDNISSGIVNKSENLIDDVGPVTGQIADGDVTDDARPTWSGKATEDIDHVNIYDNGALIGSAQVEQDGTWSFTPEKDLAEGDHEFTVSAVDKAGNEGQRTSGTDDSGWSFVVDTSIPGKDVLLDGNITLTDNVGPVQGTVEDGSVIDDARPIYSGTISANGLKGGVVSVNVYDKDVLIGSATVDKITGVWSFRPENALASGSHSLTVAAVNAAGNEGPKVSGTADESWDFTLLTSAPAQPSIESVNDDFTHGKTPDEGPLQKGQSTNDSTLTLNGSAEANLNVIIWAEDSAGHRIQVGEGIADDNGRWSITTDDLGADGEYKLTATAVNEAGVASAETGPFPIVLDTSAPDAAIAELIDDQGDVKGVITAGGITDDNTPILSGTGEAGATVQVYVDGELVGTATVGEDGTWTQSLSLTEGDHSYHTIIIDVAGNETLSEKVNFTVDSSAVMLTIDHAMDNVGNITGKILHGEHTDDNTPELHGTTYPNAVVTLKDAQGNVCGTATADENGKWHHQLEAVADGEHSWVAEVTSSTGNVSTANITLTVNTAAPGTPVIVSMTDDVGTVQELITESGNVTDDPAPTFNGTAAAGSLITIFDGDNVLGQVTADKDGYWNYTPTTNMVEGEHSITITSTNKLGNESERSPEWIFVLDTSTTAPSIEVNTEQEIGGTAEPGSTITITRPADSSESSVVADENGNWNFKPNPLQPGDNGATVVATDPAGNTNSTVTDGPEAIAAPGDDVLVEGSVVLTDDVGPVQGPVADGSVIDDAQPTYSGVISSAGLAQGVVSVNIYDNGELLGSAEVDQITGTWSFTPATMLASGAHGFTVAAVNAAGKEGPQMSGTDDESWDFTLLTSAPSQPSIENVSDNASHGEDADTGFLQKGQYTNDSTLTLNGTAAPALKVQVWATDSEGNRVLVGEGVVNQDGHWSITTSELGADDVYNLTAVAVNDAGVSSAETGPFPIVLDTTAPEAAVADLIDAQGVVQGVISAGGTTDDRTPTLQGTGEAGAMVDVYLDGSSAPFATVKVSEDGSWTLQLPSLNDGDHSYQTRTTDTAGNETRGEVVSFTVDTRAVTLTIDQANDNAGSITGAILNGGLTDDNTPELEGTTLAHAVVTIKDATGAVQGTAMADENGQWRFQLGTVADGEHTWTAEVTGKAGNTATANITLTVDTVAPSVPTMGGVTDDVGLEQGLITQPGGIIDDAAPTFNGTAEPGSVITIYDGEDELGQVTADKDGNWSYTPTTNLTDGEHSITLTATDEAGNESEHSPEWSFVLDTSKPGQPSIDTVSDNVTRGDVADEGFLQKGQHTNDSTPTLTGTAGAGLTVQIWAEDREGLRVMVGEGVADDSGHWSITTAALGADGEYKLTAVSISEAGTPSAETGAFPIVLDTVAPDAAAAELVDQQGDAQGVITAGGLTDDRTPILRGTGEAGATVDVFLDGSSTPLASVKVDKDSNWTLQLPSLADGEHEYQIRISDAAGNETLSDAVSFTVDTRAVTLTIDQANDNVGSITGAIHNGGLTDDNAPELQGTTLANAAVTIKDATGIVLGTVAADENGQWRFQLEAVADGEHTWTAEMTSQTGNTATAKITLTVQTVPPAVPTITDMIDDVGTVQGSLTESGGVTDDPAPTFKGRAEPGTIITVYDGENALGQVMADKDGNWNYTPTTNLVEGEHSITITGTDEAGNESAHSPEWNFTLDISTVAPTVEVNTENELGGTAEPGSTITITRPATGSETTVVTDENGHWSFSPNPLEPGDSDVTIVATDPVGNSNSTLVNGPDDVTSPGDDALVEGSITLTDNVGPVQGGVKDGSVIDDAQPVYAGTISTSGLAQGVISVNIYDNGELIGAAAVNQTTGAWSFRPETTLASGSHGFTVAAVDASGNEGPRISGTADESWDFTLLTSAPAQPSIENVADDYSHGHIADTGFLQKGQHTNDSTLTLNGSAAPDLRVQIWAEDSDGHRVLVGEGATDEKGHWTITTAELGADGEYKLTAISVNAAGVTSAETGAFPIVLDTQAPDAATAELFDEQGDVQGVIEAAGITDDRTPTLRGTGEAGASVDVYLDGGSTPVGSTTIDEDGNWTLQLPPLADGEHRYQTSISDAAGNETRGEDVNFTVDTRAVELTIDQINDDVGSITGAVLNGGRTDDSTPELQGTTLANAVVTIKDAAGSVLGTTTADENGVWTWASPALTDGKHSWTAEVTNQAGNTATASITLTVDTLPPVAPVIAGMVDDVGTVQFASQVQGNVTDDPSPTLSGTAEAGTLITLYDAGKVLGQVYADEDGNWSYTPTTNLVEGTHSITATATDVAGNVSEPGESWSFVLDTTPPNVGISGNSAESLRGQSEPGVVITVIDPEGNKFHTVADDSGRWILTPNPVPAGMTGQIYATDPAGNQGVPVSFQGSALASYDLLNESARVNTTQVGDQANPTTTKLADGRIVVIWQGGTGSDSEVFMQLYAADGVHKIGTEQQVNQRTNGKQDSPQVVALADGGFLVVYESWNGGLDPNGDGVLARRYGPDGQAVTDEFLVNTTTSGDQNRPSVMAKADGGYIITWEDQDRNIVQRSYGEDNQPTSEEVLLANGSDMGKSGGPEMAAFTDEAHQGMYITVWNSTNGPADNKGTGVVGQILGTDGKPMGGLFQVNSTMDGNQNYPDVITLKDGSFVVFWDSTDSGANGSDIRAVHYTVDPVTGALQVQGTGDFIVNTYTAGKQYKPVGVALEDGGYLIVWGSEGGDGSGSAIYAQRYDAHSQKVGREFMVNTTTYGNQGYGGDSVDVTHIVDATLMADGNVYITWQSDNVDSDGSGVEGIVLNPDAAYYSEFTVNTVKAGDQTHSSVTALPDGGSIVVWQSSTGDGSGTCIKGQMLDAKGQPIGGEFMVNTATAGDQLSPRVATLPNGDFEVVWSSGNYIKGQKFTWTWDADSQVTGVMASGNEININTGTDADRQTHPTIAPLADGGYLVVWQATADGKWQIYARQYDENGTPVNAQTSLVTTNLDAPWLVVLGDWNPLPSISTLTDGRVAVAYTDKATGYDSMVVIYDPATQTTSTPIMVNQTTENDQASPQIVALANGNFVVSWDSDNHNGPDQRGYGVWGRLYDANGEALSNEFMINTATVGDQHQPVIVSHADGSFVVVFLSSTDGQPGVGTYGIYAQYFDANGHKVGQQMQINQLTYGDQVEVDATFLAGGQLYVTWTDKGVADGNGSAIKGRIVDLDETLSLRHDTASNDEPTLIDYQPATPAVVDTVPPNVGISTNNATALGGQTEPGAIVTVTDSNGKAHVTTADSNGAWRIEPNPLAVGENGGIKVADTAGNESVPVYIRGAALGGYDLLNESTQVNTTTAGDQANPTTTCLADGRIVVIWQGDGISGTELYMQMYEANGVNKIGTEQQVNQRTSGYQDSPQVVALSDGGFLVVFESFQGGLDPSGDGVVARRYGADGQAKTDEFLVNTSTQGDQKRPSAMATADGGYIITWEDQQKSVVQRTYGEDDQPVSGEVVVVTGRDIGVHGGPEMAAFTDEDHQGMYITVWNASNGPSDTSGNGIVGQIFGADGKALGSAFQVNTTMDGNQHYPDVITLKDGSFVVFWDSADSDADGVDIRAVHYSVDPESGQVEVQGSGDFIVNSYTEGLQYKPVGVALEDGGYLIIWGSEGGDGDGSAIYAQRYDANDQKVGREFIVNTTTHGNQGFGGESIDVTHVMDATLMADGNVYVTWQSDNVDGKQVGIEGIVVNPDAAYYSEFQVNTSTAGDQSHAMVVSLPNGGLFQVWVSSDGSGSGIKGQMLDAKGQPVGSEFTVNSTVAGNQLTPVVLENGNISVVWSSPASGSANYIKGQQFTYTFDKEGNVNGLTPVAGEYNITSGVGATWQSSPSITALDDGGYIVVWQAVKEGSLHQHIYGRQYDANGMPVTAEMEFGNSNVLNLLEWSPLPKVTTLNNGLVVVTYATKGDDYDIAVQLYDPNTHVLGANFIANQTLSDGQASSSVSALDNGNFVVTWDSNNHNGPDQSGFGVWGRIYDAEGNAVTDEFLINTVTAGNQHLAQVVSRADGSFVAVFVSSTDTAPGEGTNGIYAQYFDANGNKIGQQMQINQLTYGDQVEVTATFMEGGQLYVSWTDKGVGDGDGSAIKGRIVDLSETLGLGDDGNGVSYIEYQPAKFYINGTEEGDVLDARGAIEVDAKGGDDTIVINSASFTSLDGGEGLDTLVWSSANNLELGSVSARMSSIEAIHMGNNVAQMLVIDASDVLDLTKANGDTDHTLRITGDDGNGSGAKDSVNINKAEWTASDSQLEKGVNYDVYVHNDDPTIKLMIQHGMNVL